MRRVLATLALVLGLGIMGAVAGPGWSPQPFAGTLVVETADLTIGSDAITAPVGTYEVASELVPVTLNGATVEAEISAPAGGPAGARYPALLFMHGAGTGHHTAFQETARALASAGIVAMVPDKRLDTYTTRSRDYPAMAQDYLGSLAVLRERPDVDPARVGVYGESEGGWVSPIAAATSPDVAFLVQVSAPVVTPRQQAAFATDSYLRNVGAPPALLRAIPRSVGAHVPGGGFEYADFDVRPYQREVTQPTLVVYGTADASMPIIQGAEYTIEDLAVAGNTDYTVRYVEGANHGIRVDGELVDEFLDLLARWIEGLPATADATPRIAGDQPEQDFRADPVQRPRWFADGDLLVLGLQLTAAAIVVGPVLRLGAAAVRRPPRALPEKVASGMKAAVVGSAILLVAFAGYVYRVARLALDYRTDPVFVQGGWLVVQLIGIIAAGLLVVSAARVVAGVRSGGLKGAGWLGWLTIAGVHGGVFSLLGIAAYWGVFYFAP